MSDRKKSLEQAMFHLAPLMEEFEEVISYLIDGMEFEGALRVKIAMEITEKVYSAVERQVVDMTDVKVGESVVVYGKGKEE